LPGLEERLTGTGLWVARYRDKSSKPMKLPKAKTYALEMVKGIRPGRVIADPIGRLHRVHVDVHESIGTSLGHRDC
jgi:hypothetical protein